MQDVTGAKISQNGFRERHNPVFVPLGLDDADQHPGRINIGYLQIDQFAQSQPRSIKHFDHATVLDVSVPSMILFTSSIFRQLGNAKVLLDG